MNEEEYEEYEEENRVAGGAGDRARLAAQPEPRFPGHAAPDRRLRVGHALRPGRTSQCRRGSAQPDLDSVRRPRAHFALGVVGHVGLLGLGDHAQAWVARAHRGRTRLSRGPAGGVALRTASGGLDVPGWRCVAAARRFLGPDAGSSWPGARVDRDGRGGVGGAGFSSRLVQSAVPVGASRSAHGDWKPRPRAGWPRLSAWSARPLPSQRSILAS